MRTSLGLPMSSLSQICCMLLCNAFENTESEATLMRSQMGLRPFVVLLLKKQTTCLSFSVY